LDASLHATGSTDPDLLSRQAERIRASGALGRSKLTQRLFDFLLDCSQRNVVPREIDIAVDVFGRTEEVDISQDASVRVYVHRLRRKLDEFYADHGRDELARLTIPKGEYRIEARPLDPDAAELPGKPESRRSWTRLGWAIAAGFACLIVANVLVWRLLWPQEPKDAFAPVRDTTIWSEILSDNRPIIVAVGDYYIFGETDQTMNVHRLVREFSINSREDLYEFLMNNPKQMDNYVDIGLRYLPISVAYALDDVLPVLNGPGEARSRIRIILASQVTPEMMKTDDVIYIGYLSGLGMLEDAVFAGSRYSIGDSYDEIIDDKTKKKYFSQVNYFQEAQDQGKSTSRDYGLASTFLGPTGNRFIIIAGTRDVAVRQVADEITSHLVLTDLAKRTDNAKAYEALYVVEAMKQMNMEARLLQVSPLDSDKIWSSPELQKFPAQ
jgi:hypothetical protein